MGPRCAAGLIVKKPKAVTAGFGCESGGLMPPYS